MLTVETRHFHVANDQVEGFLRGAVQGFAAVQEHFDQKIFVLQNVGDESRNRGFILDHQDARFALRATRRGHGRRWRGGSAPGRPGGSGASRRHWGGTVPRLVQHSAIFGWSFRCRRKNVDLPLRQRKFQGENGSALRAAQHVHGATMLANNIEHDGETQAGAHSGGLGGEEGIENTGEDALRHARAIVFDG